MKQRLADVTCPVAIFQGTEDQIIDPKSANSILDKISSTDTSLHMIPSKRHGILSEDIGGTQELVTAFLMSLSSDEKDLVTTGEKVSGDLNGPGVGRAV